MPLMATQSPVSAIDPNGRGGDEREREEGRQQAASPLRLSESSVCASHARRRQGVKELTAGRRQEGGEDGGSGTRTLRDAMGMRR